MSQQMQTHRFAAGRRFPLTRVMLAYGAFAALWVAASYSFIRIPIENPHLQSQILLAAGITFAAISTVILFFLFHAQKIAAERRENQLLQNLRTLPFVGMAINPPDMRGWWEFNDRLCEILGYTAEELRHKTWPELTHPADAELDREEHKRIRRGESDGYTAERRFVRKDGTVIQATINVRSVRLPDGETDYLVVTLKDTTERKGHQARIDRVSKLYAAHSQCNQAIVHSSSLKQLLPQVCEAAVQFGGMKMAWIGMVDESGDVLPVAAHGISLEYLASVRVTLRGDDLRGQGPVGCAIRENRPVWNQNFLNDSFAYSWYEEGKRLGWMAAAALPLHLNGKVIGAYALYAGETDAFDETAQALLVEMTRDIEFALENFQREEASRQMAQAVRDSENRFRDLFQNAPLPYQSVDIEGNILEVNSRWLSILGYSREEVIGRFFGDFVSEKSPSHPNTEFPRFKETGKIEDVCYEVIRKDGSTRQWVVNGQIARDREGNFLRTHCIFTDITERRKAQEQLHLAAKVFEQSSEGIIMVDASNRIVMVNEAFTAITGYTLADALGKNPGMLASGRHDREYYRAMREALENHGRWQGEIWNRKKDGSVYPEWLSITCILDDEDRLTHYIGIFSDLTEHKATQEHIHRLAHFDALTGLPNRVLLGERSRMALSMAQRHLEPLAVMFLDLDHFKNVNDSLGHRIGDSLLKQFSQRLNSLVREQDTLSRLGGDEFILVLPGTNVKGAANLAEKLLAATEEPYHVEGYELGITCSIGIAMYPRDGRDFDSLTQSADVAMYRAKQNGRNSYSFFTADMQARSAHALELENALRRALERNQLSLHYQPQISIKDCRIVGVEALLRWKHPKFGYVPPSEFIPVAESSGLILSIGEWVLRTAVAQMKTWVDKGFMLSTMAVNLSAVQFRHPHLSEMVMKTLCENGLPSHYLELELTEGAAMENPMAAIAVMDRLHENGIRMSIDDFGIGHSSLGYLKRFRVYKLKIDRAFVRDIPTDPDDTALVGAVISLAASMGLRTVAEGVENEGQLTFLRAHGCNEIQGHYFSEALPAEDMEALLSACKEGPLLAEQTH